MCAPTYITQCGPVFKEFSTMFPTPSFPGRHVKFNSSKSTYLGQLLLFEQKTSLLAPARPTTKFFPSNFFLL